MENLKNRIILVTGSSDGIGKQTALDLAVLGAHVIVHGRNPERALQTLNDVKRASGSDAVSAVSGDLSSMEEIRKLSGDIQDRYDRIDVLINNAGVYQTERTMNSDGIELTFAINHLSFFLLTGLLLDLVNKSSSGRIVNVASQAHANQLDFENLQGEKYFEGYDAYARSKLCNILFTYRLAERLSGSPISANVLHPGVIRTKLLLTGWGSGGARLTEGSKTSVFLAYSPEVEGISGKYFMNRRIARSSSISYDRRVQERLWVESEKMTNFIFPSF